MSGFELGNANIVVVNCLPQELDMSGCDLAIILSDLGSLVYIGICPTPGYPATHPKRQ